MRNSFKPSLGKKLKTSCIVVTFILFLATDTLAQCRSSAFLGVPTEVCGNATPADVVLQGSDPGTSYQLYVNGNASGGSFWGNGGIIKWSGVVGYSYQVKGAGGNCSQYNSGVKTITTVPETINYTLKIETGGKPPFLCQGEGITLTPSGGTNLSWTEPRTVYPTETTTYELWGSVTTSCGGSYYYKVTLPVRVSPKVSQISINSGPSTLCQGGASTYTTIGGHVPGYPDNAVVQWTVTVVTSSNLVNDPGTYSLSNNNRTCTVNWNPNFAGTADVKVTAFSGGSCNYSTTSVRRVVVNPMPSTPSVTNPTVLYNSSVSLASYVSNAGAGESYTWYDSPNGTTQISPSVGPLNAQNPYVYYVGKTNGNCTTPANQRAALTVSLYLANPSPATITINTCGPKQISANNNDPSIAYYLQTVTDGRDTSKPISAVPSSLITSTGSYFVRAKANNIDLWSNAVAIAPANTIVNPVDIILTQYDSNAPLAQSTHSVTLAPGFHVPSGSNFTARIAITEECNNYMNWTESVVYNENAVPIANSRTYYDGFGQALQTQSKNFAANSVFANQTLFDTYNQPAASTLAAPILEKDFIYKRDLAVNASNNPYSAADFDVRTSTGAPGELNTPNPFGTTPGTIGWYYSSANNLEKLTPTTQYPYARSFSQEGPDPTSSISSGPGDQHRMGSGHETKSDRYNITNELTHYYGLRAANKNAFGTSPTPTLAIKGYFYVATDPDGKRTASFVDADGRSVASALITSPTSTVNPPFTYDYWSYSYYNDLGQVLASVAPKGVNTASTAMPGFVTYYKYDHLGQLIETTSPDEGTSRFVYSIDGKIRFSQNQEQANAPIKRFSYTNYDYLGRLIESGEYSSSGLNPFVFEPATTWQPNRFSILRFKDIIENPVAPPPSPDFPPGPGTGPSYTTWPADVRCTDVTKIFYDTQQSDFPADPAHPAQTYLYGQVAKTINANATTWYGYDENGQLLWSKQNIAGLGIKTIDYTYDFVGNVTRVAYQAGATDAFYHHYTYDINQRLAQVATSKDGVNQTLQAKYYYYLHGPLKRVELAGSLQGIDYVYNINGSLKSINDVDAANDPGRDGAGGNAFSPDAFGMTLNYYNNDYQGADYTATNVAGDPSSNSFGGLIKSQNWFTPLDLGASKKAYAYTYDNRNQFQNAQWGNVTGTTGNFTATFDANAYKENITHYDKNGNILGLNRKGQTGNTLANYSYTYKPNNNQLASVTGGTKAVAYTYNTIGQMTQQTEGTNTLKVTYTAYGLVSEVRDAANKLIESFGYDDRGDKVSRTFYTNDLATKKTFYVYDASGNVLAMYDQTLPSGLARLVELPIYGAGRIGEYKPGGLQGDRFLYELTDHLGNVRAVIGKPYTEASQATVETLRLPQEEKDFVNVDKARRVNTNLFDHTFDGNAAAATANGAYAVRLSGTGIDGNTREKYGLAKELSVMPGDRVQMDVYAKYLAIPANSNAFLTGLAANMALGSTALGGMVDGSNYAATTSSTLPYASVQGYGTNTNDGAPRAYLAYMVFDKKHVFKPEKSGFKKISTLAAETGTGVTSYASEGKAHEKLSITLDVTEPGYVYVYLTNQEATPKEVYFDDFTVTQLHSPFVAGGDYYPFGLPMADRQMDAEPYKWGYQGQYAEKDSLMNMNSFMLRMYDADLVHLNSPDPYRQFASPYVWVGNNPVNNVDPNGGVSICISCITETVNAMIAMQGAIILSEVLVTASRISASAVASTAASAALSVARTQGNCPPGVYCDYIANAAKNGLEIGGNVGDAAGYARFEMIAARTGQSALSNVGRSGNLKTIYWLGQGGKWLGRAGNAGAVLSVAMDANSVSKGTMSVHRFSYNTLGAGAAIGVGAAYGGPYGALVGAGFTAGQMAYDGVVWFGDQVSQAAAQFNNAWRNGWYPGKR
jgi:RHS repeat-associated protein